MNRHGYTLIEILVALVIFATVSTMALAAFQYQNSSWRLESEKVEAALMAKGTLDELTYSVRTTGSGLPQGSAGLKVWGSGPERLSTVSNQSRWVDTSRGFAYLPTRRQLRIAIDSAGPFSDKGFARLAIYCPPSGLHAPSGAEATKTVTLPIVERVASSARCGDTLVLDASSLVASPNSWSLPGDVSVRGRAPVHNVDSTTFRKSGDTLYYKRNNLTESVYALGVDTLILRYWHPVVGWQDSLSPVSPANHVDKVLIRLVVRNRTPDKKRLQQVPSSRGYIFSKMETEVALRNDSLVNR